MNNVASVQDERHSTPNTAYTYDPANRLASVTQTLAGAPNGIVVTSYGYDINGDLTSVTDPNGNVTTYVYDDFGRMLQQTSPVTGVTTYTYDLGGDLISTTDANGATTTRTYDALGRVMNATSTRGASSEVVMWTYDSGPFGIGRVRTMSDPAGVTTYGYDRRGLVASEARTAGAATYTTIYRYDADGNRNVITYPNNSGLIELSFDLAGRPVGMGSGSAAYLWNATYLPFGPLTGVTFSNGTVKTMQYDSRYQLTENKLTGSSGVLADYVYTTDGAGNITAIHDAVDASYDRTFAYDDLNRLTTASTGASLWRDGSFTYDAMGNMLSRSLGSAPADDGTILSIGRRTARDVTSPVDQTSFTYEGTTPKLSVATVNGLDHTMSYDAAGNETQFYVTRGYSPRNFLASVSDASTEGTPHVVQYGYDGRGVRVARTESPTAAGSSTRYSFYSPELQLLATTVDNSPNFWLSGSAPTSLPLAMSRMVFWFGGLPVMEYGPPRTPPSTTVLSRRKPQVAQASSLFYTFTDHLGTPILQTDLSGAVVWRAEYEPFGTVWKTRAGAPTDQPLRFPGQEYESNWDGAEESYNIFRWYRAGWGRYTQADPIGVSAGVNVFAYAYGLPTSVTDPRGLYGVNKSRVREVPISNVRAACPGLGPACTVGFGATLDCHCDCNGKLSVDLLIYGTIYYFPGNPSALGTQPFDRSAVDAFSSIAHEWSWHLDLGIQRVDPIIRELEGKSPFGSKHECESSCGDYAVWVNYQFDSVVSATQTMERSKHDPRKEF